MKTSPASSPPLLRIAAVAVIGCSALLPACSKKEPDPEAAVRMAFVERQALAADAGRAFHLTSTEEVFFDDGWYPMEVVQKDGVHGDVWRWMGRTSLLKLKNHDETRQLSITGWVPLHILHHPPLMTLRWNGKRVDAFLAPEGHFTRTVTISAEMQRAGAYSDFAIETSSTASEWGDLRELGYALAEVRWEPHGR